ncbi:MAG: DUF1697 domain-containing protein [Cyanobacteria bacterium P01_A01_bin.123]
MNTYIALLRGINVGGKHRLPMGELIETLQDLDLHHIKTYIQSGNVVFQTDSANATELGNKISDVISNTHGFRPNTCLLKLDELERAIASNPFPEAEAEPKTLHFYFLASVPEAPNLDALESLVKNSERFKLKEQVFYLHTPNGIGRSKLAAQVEKLLGVAATARNWRTVSQILTLAKQPD